MTLQTRERRILGVPQAAAGEERGDENKRKRGTR